MSIYTSTTRYEGTPRQCDEADCTDAVTDEVKLQQPDGSSETRRLCARDMLLSRVRHDLQARQQGWPGVPKAYRCTFGERIIQEDQCQEPGCRERPTYGVRLTDRLALLRCTEHAGPLLKDEYRRREAP
jgi:hypothetical protein